MSNIINIKEQWNDKVPSFRNKVTKVLNSGQSSGVVNPFLDRNGNLVNPYINYQSVLDNPNVSAKAKQFIQTATGLVPTESAKAAQTSNKTTTASTSVSTPTTSSGSNVSSGLVASAQKFIGTPYVWGGESMSEGGMDCSGFVYAALNDAGYGVGRTTAQGYRSYGTSVSKSEMQPGDLVFYGSNNNATHIGIYIGNGQMIHSSGGSKNTASNPGKGVSITNVDYRSDFLEARRI